MILPILYIAPTKNKGRGVFAQAPIAANTLIEVAPVLVLNSRQRKIAEQTMLYDYIFSWGQKGASGVIALGYGSIYNHSYDANCNYEMDFDNALMYFRTVKDIAVGEEICINYNAEPDDKTPVWFDAKE
jgi:uncharacterized protein